jgi:O-antigen/teichoic acid export membrane protein|tara:strand:- start:1002 stop:2477 length:1476 start_codon:yes stop_codon:yes gene_type:complete
MKDINLLTKSQKISFLVKDSSIYGLAMAISKSSSLLLLPILSYHFSPEEYGLIDYFQVILQTLVLITVFGIESSVARFFYDSDKLKEKKELVSQALLLQVLYIVLFFVFVLIFSNRINLYLETLTNSSSIIILIYCLVPFMVLTNFCSSILKWSFNQSSFLILSLGVTLINFILISIGLYLKDLSIEDFFLLSLVVYIVFSFIGVFFIKKWLIIPKKIYWFKTLFNYGLPLAFVSIFSILTPFFERTIIIQNLESYSLANFAIAAKFGIVFSTLISAFQTSWGPFSLAIYKSKKAIDTYNFILKSFAFLLSLMLLINAWLLPHLVKAIFSYQYKMDSLLLIIILLGLGIQGIGWILEIGITFSKKTIYNLYNYISSFSFGITVMYFLIEPLGIYGIAIGTTSGLMIKAILGYIFSQKVYPLAWNIFPTLKIFLTTIILIAVCVILQYQFNFNINYCFIISIFILLFFGRSIVFEKEERGIIYNWIKSKIRI